MISDIWATGWTGLDLSGFRAGETVAVFGAGPVGLLCAYSALFRGASRVYVVDYVKSRLAKAKQIGALPIDFTKGNAAQQILKLEKLGVDRSVDCCGEECVNEQLKPQQNVIINDMVDVTISGGGLGIIGVYAAQSPALGRPEADKIKAAMGFPISNFFLKQQIMRAGVVNPMALAPQLVDLVKSGRVDLSWLVSRVISIEDAPEGYRRFDQHRETKVVIRFNWENDEWNVNNVLDPEEDDVDKKSPRAKSWTGKASWKSLEDIEAEL